MFFLSFLLFSYLLICNIIWASNRFLYGMSVYNKKNTVRKINNNQNMKNMTQVRSMTGGDSMLINTFTINH